MEFYRHNKRDANKELDCLAFAKKRSSIMLLREHSLPLNRSKNHEK